jgi:hypothetical protein
MTHEDELIDMQVLYLIIPLLEKISVLEAVEICSKHYVMQENLKSNEGKIYPQYTNERKF